MCYALKHTYDFIYEIHTHRERYIYIYYIYIYTYICKYAAFYPEKQTWHVIFTRSSSP